MHRNRRAAIPKLEEDPPPKAIYTAFWCNMTESAQSVKAIWVFPTPAGPAISVMVPGKSRHWGCCNRAAPVKLDELETAAAVGCCRCRRDSAVTGSTDRGRLRELKPLGL